VATIKDVAKHAGVSASTVSYALSGKRPISAAVKKRVEKAVLKLGYVRNLQAHITFSLTGWVLILLVVPPKY
jgi:DNA-binding LacI/PurR family transcriptional regulator